MRYAPSLGWVRWVWVGVGSCAVCFQAKVYKFSAILRLLGDTKKSLSSHRNYAEPLVRRKRLMGEQCGRLLAGFSLAAAHHQRHTADEQNRPGQRHLGGSEPGVG